MASRQTPRRSQQPPSSLRCDGIHAFALYSQQIFGGIALFAVAGVPWTVDALVPVHTTSADAHTCCCMDVIIDVQVMLVNGA